MTTGKVKITSDSFAKVSAENDRLRSSLKEMLECYWGEGDGAPPPAFIKRAQKLVKELANG